MLLQPIAQTDRHIVVCTDNGFRHFRMGQTPFLQLFHCPCTGKISYQDILFRNRNTAFFGNIKNCFLSDFFPGMTFDTTHIQDVFYLMINHHVSGKFMHPGIIIRSKIVYSIYFVFQTHGRNAGLCKHFLNIFRFKMRI